MDDREQQKKETILALGRDRVLAHRTLFRHRHPYEMPLFHVRTINLFHSKHPRVEAIEFRGAAKSTIAEECIIIKACLQEHRNMLIIGETEPKAKERLRSIRNEFETNEYIRFLFGNLQGAHWGETEIELSTQRMIQARGRGQSLRGAKYLNWRPDFIFCDDLEDEESVLTKDRREKSKSWYWKTLVASLNDPLNDPIRFAATPLHEEALAVSLSKLEEYTCITVPIEYIDLELGREETSYRVSSWPDKYPLSVIDQIKENYRRAGRLNDYAQEYMCQVVDPSTKIFTSGMFIYDPDLTRTYQPVYVVYDPARTVKNTSATTGKVVASWVANRLIVWEASANLWKPDEIINDMFATDDTYKPVAIGVEEDGLNEFIMQPLRHAQMDRGHPIPIRPLKAPKGKIDFIRSLQPFFNAREVVFAGDPSQFAELSAQLLNFPTGNIDAPNALAYFLKMRPGQPMFDNFNDDNIAEGLNVRRSPCYLAANSNGQHTTAVLVQFNGGGFSVLADYIREGDPGVALEIIYREARLEATPSGHPLKLVAHQRHFAAYDTIGLRAAAAKIPVPCSRGGVDTTGREEIRSYLRRRTSGFAAVRVSTSAVWTLRAFQGGYCRELDKQGNPTNEPKAGAYALLMNGLEALLANQAIEADDNSIEYAYTEGGAQYITMRR